MKKFERNIVQSVTKERLRRKSVHFPITLMMDGKACSGFLTNISHCGVSIYADITIDKEMGNFNKNNIVTVEINSPSGGLIRLNCRVKWLRIQEVSPPMLLVSMGMETIDPSPEFQKMFLQL